MLLFKSLIHDVVYVFFSNWNLNLFTWAADRIKWLTHCSAIVLPEKRLMQVSEELFLNVKQHLQTRSKQHFNTTIIIIIVVPGCCDVISLPGDHCLFPHRWFSPPHYCCLSSQFARPQMWTDAARGKSNTWSICVSVLGRCVPSTPRVPMELTFTWTRLSASRRKLKSPKRKKGAGGWRASEILQGDRTVRKDSNKCDPDQLVVF